MRRLHFTNPTLSVIQTTAQSEADTKPSGLWYSIDFEWIHFLKEETSWKVPKHAYELNLDMSRILQISSLTAIRDFHRQYATESGPRIAGRRLSVIDWSRVAERYGGIEIAPVQYRAIFEFLWYYGWDVASGCIWDASVVKQFQEIKMPAGV